MMQAVLQPALGDRHARTCQVPGPESSFANESKQAPRTAVRTSQATPSPTHSAGAHLRAEDRRQHRLNHRNEVHDMAHVALRHAQQRHMARVQRSAHANHIQEHTAEEACSQAYTATQHPTLRQLMRQDIILHSAFSREEEVVLATTMHAGEAAQQALQCLHQQQSAAGAVVHTASQPTPQLSNLLAEVHAGAVAKRKLTQSCHGLVYKAVAPYSKQQQVPVDDLMMAGLHGLQIGVQKFDPARGNRLSTVAYMWISAKVRAAFREMAGGIWIPARTRADANRILAAQQHDGDSSLSHPGLMEQLRQQIGLTKAKFANAVRALNMQQTSLESCLPSESAWSTAPEGGSNVTSIALESVCSEDAHYATLAVQQAMQQLPEREASFIQHMYGLQDGLAKNRTQVAELMGLSGYNARKVERQAFERLRKSSLVHEGFNHLYQ